MGRGLRQKNDLIDLLSKGKKSLGENLMRADDGREKIRMQQKVIARTNNREKTTKKTRERQLKDESENLLKFFMQFALGYVKSS